MRTYFVLSIFVAAAASGDTASCPPNFGYSGFTQPSQWQYIAQPCGTEPFQSPIEIAATGEQRNQPITVRYHTMQLTVKNSGYDFRVPAAPGNTISVGDIESATLDNFHFHTPAEHTFRAQKRLDGEIHFVHKDDRTGRTVVIAILLRKDEKKNNAALQPIIDQLPIHLCDSKVTMVDLAPLLPPSIATYYRYIGSLTTPACDGDVTFLVVPTPMPIGEKQLRALRHFGENTRPQQPRNDRPITYVRP